MDIIEYYKIIKDKIERGSYEIYFYNNVDIKQINSHLESINYLIYEFMLDRKDERISRVFDYVCIPNGVNNGDNNIDFSKFSVEEFLKEVMKLKD
jgi:hypothetical protein